MSLAAKVKTAIVAVLIILPHGIQRTLAVLVRAVWPGFRSA